MRAHFASDRLAGRWPPRGLVLVQHAAAHSGRDAGTGLDATGSDGGDDAADAADEADAAPTQAMVRFAQLSPDAPALDVCLALAWHGAFQGPLLAQFAEDAGLAGECWRARRCPSRGERLLRGGSRARTTSGSSRPGDDVRVHARERDGCERRGHERGRRCGCGRGARTRA